MILKYVYTALMATHLIFLKHPVFPKSACGHCNKNCNNYSFNMTKEIEKHLVDVTF